MKIQKDPQRTEIVNCGANKEHYLITVIEVLVPAA